MAFVVQSHQFVAQSTRIFSLLVALFALYLFLRKREIGGDFWGAVIIGEALFIIQVIIGGIMVIGGITPGRWIHLLYGAVAILSWPGYFAASRGRTRPQEAFMWFLISMFLFFITFRAEVTGRPAAEVVRLLLGG
jgi:hypothetical protein